MLFSLPAFSLPPLRRTPHQRILPLRTPLKMIQPSLVAVLLVLLLLVLLEPIYDRKTHSKKSSMNRNVFLVSLPLDNNI